MALPSVGWLKRREDADRGGLAGAVVAEQAEHRARSDVQVEVAQRPQVAELLAESGRGDAAGVREPGSTLAATTVGPSVFVWRTELSYIVRRRIAVHCTTWQAIIGRSGRPRPRATVGDVVRQFVIDNAEKINEKINAKINAKLDKQATKVAAKTAKHVETLDRLAAHLETIDVWTRAERSSRKPRFNRDDIAAAAIRIADTEGFEAVSMRRLAAELDAGTMSLYHYVRTKDELLTLVVDALLAEVVLPPDQRLPATGARRSR